MSLFLGNSKITPARTAEIIALSQEIMMLSKENTELKNNGLIGTREGEYIDITDSAEARFSHKNSDGLEINGNSKQNTTNGYQILDLKDGTYTKNGVNVTIKDGVITFSGTLTGGATSIDIPITDIVLNTTDTFSSALHETGTYPSGFGRYLLDENKNLIKWSYGESGLRNATGFSPQSDTVAKYLRLAFNTVDTNYTGYSNKIMFEKGSTSHGYEPYTNGASPNPEYEQPVHSVGDNVNLFDKDNTMYKDGYYKNNDGVETSDGAVGYITSFISVTPNSDYTISGIFTNTIYLRIYYYDIEQNWISRTGAISNTTYTFTTPKNCHFIQFQYQKNVFDINTVKLEQRYSSNNL